MRGDLPPPNWLRAFEATARHLSFTLAAEELGLTQAAISKRVKLLEQHLNEPLFVRQTRSLLLTKSGEAFLPTVRDAFEQLEAGTREVFGARRSDVLAIRSTVAFSVNWLGPRLADFQRRYPSIKLRIISSVWNDSDAGRVFDLDIRYGSLTSIKAQLDRSQIQAQVDRLTWDEIMPVCSPHMRDSGALQQAKDLERETLIHVLGYQEGWGRWLKASGLQEFETGGSLQVDTSLLAFEMASRGDGVALARSSLVQLDLKRGRLVKPYQLTVPIEEAFYLTGGLHPGGHENAELFRAWLLEQAELAKAAI